MKRKLPGMGWWWVLQNHPNCRSSSTCSSPSSRSNNRRRPCTRVLSLMLEKSKRRTIPTRVFSALWSPNKCLMLVETLLARMDRSSSSQLRKLLHRTIVVICKHIDQTKLDESERIMVSTNNIVSHNLKDQPNDIAIYQEDNTEVLEQAIDEKSRRDV